ncbi:MAG: hypothetical protein LBR85_00705 [Oscillospiraceae bacterium]|jgi:hypothetical protein|nr:hypothetical protein [Oscillospiraceae bacterium]
MRKFPPKLSRILSFVIVAAVAAAFLVCGFFTGRAIQPQRGYDFSLHVKVLEVHDNFMVVQEFFNDDADYHRSLNISFSIPMRNHKARILNADGKTIPPEEIPVNSIVLITHDGWITGNGDVYIVYLIQLSDHLPET